jgi:hypothetical protein
MKLIQMLCVVLTELSVGTLLMTCLLPPREIRLSFFTFNSLLGALTAAVALALMGTVLRVGWEDVRFLGFTVIGATTAYGAFRLDKPDLGRVLLFISGFVGLIFGLLPLGQQVLAARGIATSVPWFFDASLLAGTLLLGAVNVGMILGHWYLLMRRLSFEHLLRFAQIVLGAVGLRVAVMFMTILFLGRYDAELADTFIPSLWSVHGNLFFFLMRMLWGLALPLVLGLMVLRCAQAKANQAATGMLYVVEVSVLFGEFFAAYLLI